MSASRFGAPRMVRILAVTIAAVALSGAGIVYAAWTSNGTGTATAQSGTSQTLSATALTSGLLYPNGPAVSAQITITNPNRYPVRVTAIQRDTANPVVVTGGTGSCVTHGVSFATQSGTWDVPAGNGVTSGTATFTLASALSMDATSDNGCQNAAFTVPLLLTGTSN